MPDTGPTATLAPERAAALGGTGLLADLLAEGTQDALDFTLLVEPQRAPAIAHLDDG